MPSLLVQAQGFRHGMQRMLSLPTSHVHPLLCSATILQLQFLSQKICMALLACSGRPMCMWRGEALCVMELALSLEGRNFTKLREL